MKLNVNKLDIHITECKSIYQRTKGFMFIKKNIDYGLLFKHCNSIHTFFMYQPIDVIMTDDHNNILFMYNCLKPWHVILPKKNVTRIYELPVGSIEKLNSK